MNPREGEVRIYAAKAVLANGVHPAVLEIEDGKITKLAVGDQARSTDADVVIESGYLAPGLIDLQLNGAFGTDFAAASAADWDRILKSLPTTGVTSVYPTVITAPIDELIDFFKKNQIQVGDGTVRTSVLGFHLEGPFLNLVRRGAHREQWVVEPNDKSVSEIISAASNSLKIVTIAPELPGATAAIKSFVSNNIKVSVGHSDANAETVAKAADLGATLITHLFNAQSQIGHRNTGVAGQALIDTRYFLGLIVDLHHVIAETVLLAFAAASDRICLVTDAISALGMPSGKYELAGDTVIVEANHPPKRSDGTLAGSDIRLDHAISNCINIGIDPAVAIRAASTTPASAMSLSDRGEISVGKRADLVWLDATPAGLETRQTWIYGNEVFAK